MYTQGQVTPAVRTRGLTKRYGSHPALRGLDITVEAGTVFGLIGPNGAGKTTTLRLLLDILRPTSGTVEVLRQDPRVGGAALRRRIGYLPGDLRWNTRMRGRALLRHLAEISGPVPDGAIERYAQRLGLDLDRPVNALSKGNKQKLGLVQAFIHRPALLVLDEPTSGLDPLVQREFLTMVREARDAGQTVLLSSHVLSEIQQAADDVVVLSRGRVVAAGPVETLRIASVRHIRATLGGTSPEHILGILRRAPGVDALDVSATATGDMVRVQLTAHGDIDPVIRALSTAVIADLTVEEPDLEESVLRLYSEDGDGEAHA